MFNSGIRGRRARDGEGSLQIADVFIQKNNPFVTISRYSILDGSGNAIDDLALDTAGGQTVLVVGGGFETGVTVTVGGTAVSPVVRLDSTRLTFTSPAKTSGSQALVVNNVNGSSAVFVPGLAYSGTPTFVTTAGTLGTVYETTAISTTISATSDSAITYTLDSGTLPPGSTLSSGGLLTGTAPADAASTTYTFTVRATDAELQESTRQFSITVATDVVSWQYPEDQDIVVIDDLEPNIVLDAVSAAGSSISYAASALPTGLSLSNGVITGTVSVEEDTAATLTATADTTTRSAAISVTWRVSLGDSFFKNTTLLLNGDTTAWISDASPNGVNVTPSGDAIPSAFSPYNTNWSNFFGGGSTTERRLTTSQTAIGTGNFTVAFWLYMVGTTGTDQQFFDTGASGFTIAVNSSSQFYLFNRLSASAIISASAATAISLNTWAHIAIVRSGTGANQVAMYINGVSVGTGTSSSNFTSTTISIGGRYAIDGSTWYTTFGYISNLLYADSALSITLPTSSYTNQSGAKLLTCQSNRFIDNSTNNFTLTRNGDVKVTAFGPFTETDTETGSGYLDGSGDYLSIPNTNSQFTFGTGDFCVEGWVYLLNNSVRKTFYGGSTNQSFDIQLNVPDNGVSIGVGLSNLRYDVLATTGTLSLNRWYHIAVSRQSGTLRVFLDGQSVSSTSNSGDYGANGGSAIIGVSNPGTNGGEHFFHGYISGVRVVKGSAVRTANFTPPTAPLTAISNTSLLTLQSRKGHNNKYFLDDSGNRFNLTRAGNATQGTFSPFIPSGWSARFGGYGTSQSISCTTNASLSLDANFTIEAWIYYDTVANNRAILYLGSTAVTVVTGGTLTMTLVGSWDQTISATGAISANQWTHVVVQRTSNVLSSHINGVYQSSNTATRSGTLGGSGVTFQIGTNHDAVIPEGYITNVRIIKGQAIYGTANFTPSSTPLVNTSNTSFLWRGGPILRDESYNNFSLSKTSTILISPFSPFKSHSISANSYSFYFDGNNDYLTLSASSAYDLGTQNFTFECWIHPSSSSGVNINILTMQQASGTSFFQWFVQRSGSNFAQQYGINNVGNYGMGSFNIPADRWAHVALTREGNTLRAYTNGTLVYTNTNFTYSMGSSTTNHFVGVDTGANNDWLGYISNFRIVKGTAIAPPAGGPTAPLTAVSGTSVLTCQSPTVVDNSGNGLGITVNGNIRLSQFNPFGETVTSDVQYSPTTHGGSGFFDGTGDYLSIADSNELSLSGNFTIEAWMYLRSFGDGEKFINKWSGSGQEYILDMTTGNLWRFYWGPYSTSSAAITSSTAFNINEWQHLAVARSGGTITMYLNGKVVGTRANSGNNTNTSEPFYIATYDTAINYLDGYVTGVRIMNGATAYTGPFVPSTAPLEAIPGTVVLVNGTNAAIQDITGRNVLETVGDTRIVSESPYSLNKSVYFDGTGDAINAVGTTEFQFGTGDFIVECFVFITLLNTGDAQYVVSTYDGSNGGWALYLSSSCTAISFRNGDAGVVNRSFVFSANTWYHLLVSRVSSTLRFFVNGDKVGADENSYTQNITRNNTYGCSIGRYQTSINQVGAYVNGYVSNVRVVKGSGVTSVITPTSPLTAVSGTSLLTCQSYNFKDNSTNNFAITRNGDAKITSRGPFTETLPYVRSMSFDGTGDYIQVPASQFDRYNFNTGDFTIECWIYPTALGLDDVIVASYSSWATSVNFYFSTRAGSPNIIIFRGGNSVPISISGNTAINLNTWHHVAVTRTSGVTRMFVDGITQTATHTGTVNVGATVRQMYIGCNNEIGELWTGYMEDLRITKGIARYTANFTPNSGPFKTR